MASFRAGRPPPVRLGLRLKPDGVLFLVNQFVTININLTPKRWTTILLHQQTRTGIPSL